jgi:hypothetical protein
MRIWGLLAYIDPGMGSLLYQAALASIFGLVFYWRKLWVRVASGLSRLRRPGARPVDE